MEVMHPEAAQAPTHQDQRSHYLSWMFKRSTAKTSGPSPKWFPSTRTPSLWEVGYIRSFLEGTEITHFIYGLLLLFVPFEDLLESLMVRYEKTSISHSVCSLPHILGCIMNHWLL